MNPPSDEGKPRSRRALLLRVGLFLAVVVACAVSSKAVRKTISSFRSHACASASPSPPAIDESVFPVRIGPQDNLCAGVPDGVCSSKGDDVEIRGECANGRMDGSFTVTRAQTGEIVWSGHYEGGWPRGEFKIVRKADRPDVFPVEHLHLDGQTTKWEREGDRLVEVSGRYDRGRKVGRWTRRLESGLVRSTVIFDDEGLASKEFFHCTNGNIKEVRAGRTLVQDKNGKLLAEKPTGDEEARLCPLP